MVSLLVLQIQVHCDLSVSSCQMAIEVEENLQCAFSRLGEILQMDDDESK